jgi:transcriptional regulator with XRE-family HTH domain
MRGNREIPEEFAVAMEEYRVKRGISLTQLAEEVGVSTGYLSRIRKGERKAPSVPITIQIVKKLNMPTSLLLSALELKDDEKANGRVDDIYDLILFNNFTIEEVTVETDVKEIIVDLLRSIIASEWKEKNIVQNLAVLAKVATKIEEFKAQFSA